MPQEITEEELIVQAGKPAEDAMKLYPLIEKLKEKNNG